MGTTLVTIDQAHGFWMRDECLELWLRLLALHLDEAPEVQTYVRPIRDQWLLASKGYFGGCVPHALEQFAAEPQSLAVIEAAIIELGGRLTSSMAPLERETLDLLGMDADAFKSSLDRQRLIDVADAFQLLIRGEIREGCSSTDLMPGTKPLPPLYVKLVRSGRVSADRR